MSRIANARSKPCHDLAAVGWLVLILALAIGGSQASYAQSDAASKHDGELDRWVYSAAFEMGLFGHTGKGNVRATQTGTPRVSPLDFQAGDQRDPNVVPDDRSREDILSALLGGDFEIMTPSLADVTTHPRLFLGVNVSAALTNEVGLARDADPTELGFPINFDANAVLGETTVGGRGNKITVQHQGPQIHAGLGAALTFDIGSQRIRVKPSFVYSRIITDISVFGNRAVRLMNFDPTVMPRDFDAEFRKIELHDSVTEVYHGIGPALELEYETGNRIGPFSISLYLKGHASHLLGDLKTRLSKTNPDPTVVGNETVNWKYTQDAWVFRGSTGIRFRFVPKPKHAR